MKTCSKCGVAKDETEYFLRTDTGRLRNNCRKCREGEQEVYRRRREAAQPGYKRNSDLKRSYGLTLETFSSLLASQGGVCAICKGPPMDKNGFCVDHDHQARKVRGILCNSCNRGLGLFKDSPECTKAATEYLLKFK